MGAHGVDARDVEIRERCCMVSTIGNVFQALALVFALVSAVLLVASGKVASTGAAGSGAAPSTAPEPSVPIARMRHAGQAFVYASFALLTACEIGRAHV